MKIKCVETSAILGGKEIVKSVTIDIKEKKFIGIIGPNGSGKSTFLKCIYRVLKPSGGIIYLNDTELNKFTVKESARKMAVVSQHNYYNFDFSVQDVVLMGRAPHKIQMERDTAEDYKIVYEALKKVEMEDFASRSFSTLSGGEQQRIILARALAQQTECLILDEPTNHLDIKYQLQILNIVKKLDITVVAALHDLNIAAMYCDELYVIKNGSIMAHGAPKKILTTSLLKEIYEVDTKIIEDNETGVIHILFSPSMA